MTGQNGPDPSKPPEGYFEKPSSARAWSHRLGAKDNYPVDQKVGDATIAVYPQIVELAREARLLLARVVRHLAGEAGVRQLLDIGTGLPTMQHTHAIAQAVAPDSKIVYEDNDPRVLARAPLVNSTPEGVTTCVHAAVRQPEQILAEAAAVLDVPRPVAVLLFGVPGHAAGTAEQLQTIVTTLLAPLSAGSYLAIQDGADSGDGNRNAAAPRNYRLTTLAQFHACAEALELVEPGLSPIRHWRPSTPVAVTDDPIRSHCLLARTP